MSQKVTMLIQVIPCPRLDGIRERHVDSNFGNPDKNLLSDQRSNYLVSDTEAYSTCLAFDILPEDFFLGDRQNMETFLSGDKEFVLLVPLRDRSDGPCEKDKDCEDKCCPQIKITLFPIPRKSKIGDDIIRDEYYCHQNDKGTYGIIGRHFQKLKEFGKKFHTIVS